MYMYIYIYTYMYVLDKINKCAIYMETHMTYSNLILQ